MSNYTLCIDTSAGTSVAVVAGDETLSEINFEESMKHAERIGDAIAQALEAAKISPSEIAQVVVGRGPAPFTGLRIGIAAAVMFAEGVGAKLFGICSLDAIARAAFDNQENANQKILVTTDARRSENYWALYSGLSESGAPIVIDGPGVLKPAALAERFAGDSFATAENKVSAADLGKVFAAEQRDGKTSSVVDAMYLRDPDAVAPKVLREFGKRVSG